jgi:hypothetical protein
VTDTRIGSFADIQKNSAGNELKISSHRLMREGLTVEDEALIGDSFTLISDSYAATALRAASYKPSMA